MVNAWKPEYTQEKFYILFDGLDELVYVSDPDTYEILFVNKKIRERCGSEILGKKCYKALQNLNEPCSFCTNKYIFGENLGKIHVWEFQNLRNKHWYKCIDQAIPWAGGKPVRFEMAIDITERKMLEEEKIRFEERFSTLNKYSQNLSRAKTLGEIFKLTLNAMEKILGFEYASIFTVEGNMLNLAAYRGYSKIPSLKLPLDGEKGITVKAARTGKSILVPDVRKNEAYVEGGEAILSELAVPIKLGRKVLGVLNVESRKLAAFGEEDVKLLETLASHVAIAISNHKRQEKLSALNAYGRSLNKAKSIKEIAKLTLKAMEKALGYKFVDILLVEGKELQLVATHRLRKKQTFSLRLDGKEGITVRAARTGKSIIVKDVRREKAYVPAGFKSLRSELVVPIKVGGKVLGVLNAEGERVAAFDEEDKELLEILASHTAIALTNFRRREQLRKLSKRMEHLMKNSAKIMNIKDMHQRLKVIAEAIQKFGWRRVVISLRDENLEGTDFVAVGLTKKEMDLLIKRKAPGHVWRERLGPKFEKYRIGEFYYLPWSDPWIRENVHGVSPETPPDMATTSTGVFSRLSKEDMVDWHPQDLLYAPLRTPEGRIVGILIMDDPVDGRKPTRESLIPLELFLHQAAITIENARLIENLEKTKKELEVYATQLEQKVEERTRALKESQVQLLKAQRMAVIGELAGMVGHDLRNPLTSIAGAAYYLKKRLTPKTDGKIREMLDLMEKNIAYSNKIIDDLLDYSREIKLELAESNPKSIVRETLSAIKVPKNVHVVNLTKSKPRIEVDVGKLKRTFLNIIRNAIEAMPKGGTLTITSRMVGDNVEFVFSDTGIGMSKKTLRNLWTPLFTTKAKGMGFGLPICKRFVEAHGGSINVESNFRKGTTFTVTVPIKPKMEEGGEKIWVKKPESLLLTTTKT